MTPTGEGAARRERWIAAVESGDADAYASLVTDDVVWIPPSGEPLRGREAFRAWLEPFVGSFDYEMALTPSASREVGGWAWETGAFRSTMRPLAGGEPREHEGHYFVLWRLDEDGTWRIERYVDGVGAAGAGAAGAAAGTAERATLPEVIETDRLVLRPWELTDLEDVLAYARDPEWSRYLRMLPDPYTRADGEEFLARQKLLDHGTHPAWAITLDGAAVGGINLRLDFDNRLAEMGYSVARRHWNQGYVTEAARAVMDAAFRTHPDLNKVLARADVENTASHRVLEKIGMTKEGVLRQSRVERGEVVDEAWFGILREEWEEGLG